MVEVHGEVLEEAGLVRIVTVAEHDLAAELVAVVSELGLDIGQLGVELVLRVPVAKAQRLVACQRPPLRRPAPASPLITWRYEAGSLTDGHDRSGLGVRRCDSDGRTSPVRRLALPRRQRQPAPRR